MKLICYILIVMVFFFGLCMLVYVCSKNKCVFKYISTKRKIEIYPIDKSQNNNQQG